ncbi:hypothetical protein AAVH_12958 [Aphelenchoides avenae]|nr:hypothetical protein AAVH_12958 [Aphelenchus avenae]
MSDIIGGIDVLLERMSNEDPAASEPLGKLRSNLEARLRERSAPNVQPSVRQGQRAEMRTTGTSPYSSAQMEQGPSRIAKRSVGVSARGPAQVGQEPSEYDRQANVVPQVNYARRLFNKYWHPAEHFKHEVVSPDGGFEQEVVLTVLALIGTMIVLFYFFSATANELLND